MAKNKSCWLFLMILSLFLVVVHVPRTTTPEPVVTRLQNCVPISRDMENTTILHAERSSQTYIFSQGLSGSSHTNSIDEDRTGVRSFFIPYEIALEQDPWEVPSKRGALPQPPGIDRRLNSCLLRC